jgi:hypothetical protein
MSRSRGGAVEDDLYQDMPSGVRNRRQFATSAAAAQPAAKAVRQVAEFRGIAEAKP